MCVRAGLLYCTPLVLMSERWPDMHICNGQSLGYEDIVGILLTATAGLQVR